MNDWNEAAERARKKRRELEEQRNREEARERQEQAERNKFEKYWGRRYSKAVDGFISSMVAGGVLDDTRQGHLIRKDVNIQSEVRGDFRSLKKFTAISFRWPDDWHYSSLVQLSVLCCLHPPSLIGSLMGLKSGGIGSRCYSDTDRDVFTYSPTPGGWELDVRNPSDSDRATSLAGLMRKNPGQPLEMSSDKDVRDLCNDQTLHLLQEGIIDYLESRGLPIPKS